MLEEIAFANARGASYTSIVNTYDATGAPSISDALLANGDHVITGHRNSLTLVSDGGVDTLTGGGLDETFSLTGAFGRVTLSDFASRISSDTPSLPGAAFGDSFSRLVADASFGPTSATIPVDAKGTVTMTGLTKASMTANPDPFAFHN